MSKDIPQHLAEKIQRVLAYRGLYKGAIDGVVGSKTKDGIKEAFRRFEHKNTFDKWARKEAIAAAQIILNSLGFNAGVVDGYWGNQTTGAYLEFENEVIYGTPLTLPREPLLPSKPSQFPPQEEWPVFYGDPDEGEAAMRNRLVKMEPAYKLRWDWNLNQWADTILVHAKVAESVDRALSLILKTYGQSRLHILGLDRCAGTFNFRRMRGGKAWSAHAYGVAIDFYAAPNGLTTRCPQALFCKKEYVDFFDIWESVGWTSLGRAIGRDWMHVQAGAIR